MTSFADVHSHKVQDAPQAAFFKVAKDFKRKRTEEIRSSLQCMVSIPVNIAHQKNILSLKGQIKDYGNLPHGII